MSNRLKITAAIVIGLLFTILVILLAQRQSYGNIEISNAKDFNRITINDTPYTGSILQESQPIQVPTGKSTIKAFDESGLVAQQEIEVTAGNTTTLALNTRDSLEETDVVERLLGRIDDGFVVTGSQLLENNTWFVAFISPKNGNQEGYVSIYRLENSSWRLVESGTGYDKEYMTELGFPDSVINFIEGSSQ